MSLYLPVRTKGSAAIAICYRCAKKIYHDDLMKDPNTGAMYCKNCVDLYDPWKLPARKTENIALHYPRPDEELQ